MVDQVDFLSYSGNIGPILKFREKNDFELERMALP